MPIAAVATIILLLKILEIDPVARWSWFWVLAPFAVVFIWWEVISPMVGWDKKQAAKKMADDERQAAETKKKNRGF